MTDDELNQKALLSLLDEIRGRAQSEKEKGTLFEKLMLNYFKAEPTYADRFSDVWMWTDWAQQNGIDGRDIGIDLVARERSSEGYCAIQCKCYKEDTKITYKHTSTFFGSIGMVMHTTHGPVEFDSAIIVATALDSSVHLDTLLRSSKVPCQFIGLKELLNSRVDWKSVNKETGEVCLTPKFAPHDYQEEAIRDVLEGLATADRGKLIMACGTGKTFTSLRLAERYCGPESNVLFLVPSIALLSQSLHEWMEQAEYKMHAIAVCSDPKASQDKEPNFTQEALMDLPAKASTNVEEVSRQYAFWRNRGGMVVVFSTYQSIDVIIEAQKRGALPEFDLTICDEAHRTTGVDQPNSDEIDARNSRSKKGKKGSRKKKTQDTRSNFVLVHDAKLLRSRKRLYMTATPRIYTQSAKDRAADAECEIYSMDNSEIYGEELHHLAFSKAVSRGLLTDYKVLILCVNEKAAEEVFNRPVPREDDNPEQYQLDDAVKLLGCYNGLRKKIIGTPNIQVAQAPVSPLASTSYPAYVEEVLQAAEPSIDEEQHAALTESPTQEEDLLAGDYAPMRRAVAFTDTIEHSKLLCRSMDRLLAQLREVDRENPGQDGTLINCPTKHVDGSMNALKRNGLMTWLKANPDENECRILTNVRCLSEGVDVPALDAVMFLSPRRSQVDIVQAVGRVMRKATGKKYGYIILPIGIPADKPAHEVLDNDDKYDVIWDILQALRAHDDRFDAKINQIGLNQKAKSDKIIVGGIGIGTGDGKEDGFGTISGTQGFLDFEGKVEDWRGNIYARIVKKCGTRRYWESWSKDIAAIAIRQQKAITALLQDAETRKDFDTFLKGLQTNINPAITEKDAVEMLAQQAITRPVFDALFGGSDSFAARNPVSQTMDKMLSLIHEQTDERDQRKLQDFYESVRNRALGVDKSEGKQQVVTELYDKFFKNAFPAMAEKLGIVYTPIPIVDFIIHSVHHVLKKEFKCNEGLATPGVRVLDPFTGTGTFIVRLIQSGLIPKSAMQHKYREEMFASEIVLLAYYIACINIEEAYHKVMEAKEYEAFNGICLTDTFLMKTRKDTDFLGDEFRDNAERVQHLSNQDIRVIIGNPPYSVGQKNANDNNQNQSYPSLDDRIRETYVANICGNVQLARNLYDSYIRAFRWSSDRLGDEGVLAFITNSGFIDKLAMSGFRSSLLKEFSSVYCFNLRGALRGKTKFDSAREGENVFNIMTGVCIMVLVKNRKKRGIGKLHYHDIGDNLSKQEKLDKIAQFGNISKLPWEKLTPDAHGDWINQRETGFEAFLPLGEKRSKGKGNSQSIFDIYSGGILTARDAWCYNFSKNKLTENMEKTIRFYNNQLSKAKNKQEVQNSSIKWTRALHNQAERSKLSVFSACNIRHALYRPFTSALLYFDKLWNESPLQQSKLFPSSQHHNRVICIPAAGNRQGFSSFISSSLPDLHVYSDGTQCFPLYWYEKSEHAENSLGLNLEPRKDEDIQHPAITQWALEQFQRTYQDKSITRNDIFYYVYGILHSREYVEKYQDNLQRELPRIPFSKNFWDFRQLGEELADWHLNYETVEPYPLKEEGMGCLRVEKLRWENAATKEALVINKDITLRGIPAEAHEYIVSGRTALEWLIDRYKVRTDKKSGIVNDPNDWGKEHGNERYIIDLVKRVVRVSVETVKLVKQLPPLDIIE